MSKLVQRTDGSNEYLIAMESEPLAEGKIYKCLTASGMIVRVNHSEVQEVILNKTDNFLALKVLTLEREVHRMQQDIQDLQNFLTLKVLTSQQEVKRMRTQLDELRNLQITPITS